MSEHYFYSADPICWKCRKSWRGSHTLNSAYDWTLVPEDEVIKDMKVCEAKAEDFYVNGFGVCIKIPKVGDVFVARFTDKEWEHLGKYYGKPEEYPTEVAVKSIKETPKIPSPMSSRGGLDIEYGERGSLTIESFTYFFLPKTEENVEFLKKKAEKENEKL